MPTDPDESGGGEPSTGHQSDSNKSFVKKVKSRVSGLLPSSLSKWFGNSESGPKVRQREELEDEDDDDTYSLQPPSKRAKPSSGQSRESLEINFVSTPIHGNQNMFSNLHREFSEPIPGPSGIRSCKLRLPNVTLQNHFLETVDVHNGDKDSDSGESTSGYSSMPRIGSKEHVSEVAEKRGAPSTNVTNSRSLFSSSYSRHERTLFPDRSAAPQLNASLSSRRPTFNTKAFGSPNFMDRTLSTKRIVNSPFYAGRTIYGGAAACRRQEPNTSPDGNSCLKSFVRAKPGNDAGDKKATLSNTAKRILTTLEQYTSPTEDVRRIPNPSLRRVQRPEGLISKYTGVNPYLVRDSRVSSNKELIVPTVSDLLKMKMKGQLQDSTVSVREMATTSNSPLNTERYTLRTTEHSLPAKNTNKMKTKVVTVRQKPADSPDVVETVKLPDVRLPISTLPSFDFTIPSPYQPISKDASSKLTADTETPKAQSPKPQTVKIPPTDKKDFKPVEYKFSKPLVLAENLKSIKAINNFKFSEPVYKKESNQLAKINFTSFTCKTTFPSIKKVAPKNNGENGSVAPAKELLKTGSVMDILGKSHDLMEKFKPAEGTWECKKCLVRNKQDSKTCAACSNLKDTEQKDTGNLNHTGFGDRFKITSAQWECSECMVRNEANQSKCVACANPKIKAPEPSKTFGNPTSNTWECKTCLIRNIQDVKRCKACGSVRDLSNLVDVKNQNSSFGDKFKITSMQWECSVCMVRNDTGIIKCSACENPRTVSQKPCGGFGNLFKMPTDKWECSVCMVRNNIGSENCVSCTNPKPATGFGDKFKMPADKWKCSVCMVQNDGSSMNCVACTNPKAGGTSNLSTIGFGDKFKPKGDTWECGLCLVRNNENISECVACAHPKPGKNCFKKLSESLKKKDNEWNCDSCLVRNPDTKDKCQCCETPRPGSIHPGFTNAQEQAIPKFNFGIDKGQINGHGFTFGIPPASKKDSETTKVNPLQPTDVKPASIPKPTVPPKAFTFGIPVTTPPIKPSKRSADNSKIPTVVSKTNIPPSVNGDVNNGETVKRNAIEQETPISNTFSFDSKTPPAKKSMSSDIPADKTQHQYALFKFKTPTGSAPLGVSFGSNITVTPTTTSSTRITVSSSTSKTDTAVGKETPGFTFTPKFEHAKPGTLPSPLTMHTKTSFKSNQPETAISEPGFSFSTGTTGGGLNFAAAPVNKSDNPFGSASKTTNLSFVAPTTVAGSVFGGPVVNSPAFGVPATNVSPFTSRQSFGGAPKSSATTFGAPQPAAPPAVFGGASFGAPAQPAQNGMFNFGSNATTTTPKTGFNFGANPAPSGGFNFGAASTNANSSGGFKFGPTGPATTFNADAKPSFNFTSGAQPSAFTAQPQGGETKPTATARVIKRALRRTQR